MRQIFPRSGKVTVSNLCEFSCELLRQEHTGLTVGRLNNLGRLGQGQEQICLVCSAALEAFRAVQMLSAPIEHAKSEEVGCRTSEPLDSLLGSVLVNQRGVWEGRK